MTKKQTIRKNFITASLSYLASLAACTFTEILKFYANNKLEDKLCATEKSLITIIASHLDCMLFLIDDYINIMHMSTAGCLRTCSYNHDYSLDNSKSPTKLTSTVENFTCMSQALYRKSL